MADQFVFLDDIKITNSKSFFNRTKVNAGGVTKWLTIPLDHETTKGNLNSVCPSDEAWLSNHIRTLGEWYRGSIGLHRALNLMNLPAFTSSICKFDMEFILGSLEELQITTSVSQSSTFGITSTASDRLIEICKRFNATNYLTGHGGFRYLDHLKFEENNINVSYIIYDWDLSGLNKSPEGPFLSVFDYFSLGFKDMASRSKSKVVPWREFNEEMIGFHRVVT